MPQHKHSPLLTCSLDCSVRVRKEGQPVSGAYLAAFEHEAIFQVLLIPASSARVFCPNQPHGCANMIPYRLTCSSKQQADRQWHQDLLTGGMLVLLESISNSLTSSSDSPLPPSKHRARGAHVVDFSCVEPDFMLHNRQLLPFANHTCGSSGRYQQATASLRAEWHRLAHNAAGAQCDGLSTLRFELQLSGFFSMMSSVLKPWTAAIRLGRSFLTPSAHGLISRRLCTARDLSCFFKPLGPDRCQPAPLWVPQAHALIDPPDPPIERLTCYSSVFRYGTIFLSRLVNLSPRG